MDRVYIPRCEWDAGICGLGIITAGRGARTTNMEPALLVQTLH
jgi:hypothetical protein